MSSSPAAAQPEQDAPARRGFEVRLDNFSGPFDLLLQLIGKHQLDITEVALAAITDEFIAHIRAMDTGGDLEEISNFLLVAATLLDLKAARLLPGGQVDDDEDLAVLEARDLLFARLLQYRAYKQVAAEFADRMATAGRRVPRSGAGDPAIAALLPELVFSLTPEQLAGLARGATAPKPEPEQVGTGHLHGGTVSVAEQAAHVVAQLRRAGVCRFRDLIADGQDTLVVVARFLSLLELYREQVIVFEQAAALGELTVRWVAPQDREVAVGTEFDQDDAAPAAGDAAQPPHGQEGS
ncbi:MAG: segregation/condensation protein A [Micrococcales bacterium]|nr:MAG: segregation/condensation protein A [Micrococcales bacterium]PIE28064.1 MAG: segregation/condensation protein A [Micrococcales bacterium]